MGVVATLFLILVFVVIMALAGNEVLAFVNGTTSGIFDNIRDREASIPSPPVGSTIADLTVTVKPKIKATGAGAGCPVLCTSVDYIIFLNKEGGTVSQNWSSIRLKTLSLGELNTLGDYLFASSTLGQVRDLQTNELIIPTTNSLESKFKLSYILVDPETGLKKELQHYQNIEYKFPTFTKEYTVTEKLVFRGIEKKNYELWIIPEKVGFFDTRFNDKSLGEPYKQGITG